MDETTVCVAVFEREQSLVRAIKRVVARVGRFRASAIGRATGDAQTPVGFYDDKHGLKRWDAASIPLAGAYKPLRRAALLWLGDVGPVRVGGALVSWMRRAWKDAVVFDGVTLFGLALHAIGLPEDVTRRYDLELLHGKYLLLTDVAPGDSDAVSAEMRRSGATSVECIPGVSARMLSRLAEG